MKKISTSLACKYCGSFNIDSTVKFYNKKTRYEKDLDAKIITKHRIYKCRCNNCKKNYIVDHGIDKFTLFKKPYKITETGDVKLFAEYVSQSSFVNDYKICSVNISSYLRNEASMNEVYLVLTDNDKYPIVLPKQDLEELLEKPEKVKSLTLNTFFSRYR